MFYDEIHVNQLESFLEQPDAVVIDIRDIRTFNAGHIKGALHIDGSTMSDLIRQRKNNPPVLVYCYHGNSSHDMAKIICGFGFTRVSHLVGGWAAWSNYHKQSDGSRPMFSEQTAGAFA